MGYRKAEHYHVPRNERRNLQKTATPGVIYMHEGQTMSIALPCFYREILRPKKAYYHNRPHHDHIGWPDPRRPDASCQDSDFARSCCDKAGSLKEYPTCHDYIDMERLFPIHLKEEGYTKIRVVIAPNINELDVEQEILTRYGKAISVPESLDDIEEFVSSCEEAGVARGLVNAGVEYANQKELAKAVESSGRIDEEDDWIIRVDLDNKDTAKDLNHPCTLNMAVYAETAEETDLVGVFKLTIMPAAGASAIM